MLSLCKLKLCRRHGMNFQPTCFQAAVGLLCPACYGVAWLWLKLLPCRRSQAAMC